jgi:hypothetical protein
VDKSRALWTRIFAGRFFLAGGGVDPPAAELKPDLRIPMKSNE